jgi:hypothetical protein
MTELTKCLILLGIPGTKKEIKDDVYIKLIVERLTSLGIKFTFCDTVAGWGCLNQDWLEFECAVKTSWDWCRLDIFPIPEWEKDWYPVFESGQLLMQVLYVTNNEEPGKKYIHHH